VGAPGELDDFQKRSLKKKEKSSRTRKRRAHRGKRVDPRRSSSGKDIQGALKVSFRRRGKERS